MSVSVLHLWTCDICGAQTVQVQRSSSYSDPVITPPANWREDFEVPVDVRRNQNINICDACPACQKMPVWSQYSDMRG